MLIVVVLLVVSVFIIWRACEAFDIAANLIGRNMSGGVRGATLNAAGSSMPELITLLVGILVFGDRDGIAVGIGTIAGSAIYNIAVIPALSIIAAIVVAGISKISVSSRVIVRDTSWLIGVQAVFIGTLLLHWLDMIGGALLTLLYVIYVAMLLWSLREAKSEKQPLPEPEAPTSRLQALPKFDIAPLLLGRSAPHKLWQAWALLLVAVVAIGVACWMLVDAVYRLGDMWAIEPYFVAVIIAAAATSIPDTILSVNDALRGEFEDAISNAVGSNIFNISFGIGFPVLMVALSMGESSNLSAETLAEVVPLLVLLVPIYAVIGWVLAKWQLNLRAAILLLGVYCLYVSYIVAQAMGWVTLFTL